MTLIAQDCNRLAATPMIKQPGGIHSDTLEKPEAQRATLCLPDPFRVGSACEPLLGCPRDILLGRRVVVVSVDGIDIRCTCVESQRFFDGVARTWMSNCSMCRYFVGVYTTGISMGGSRISPVHPDPAPSPSPIPLLVPLPRAGGSCVR
jgi:hypothetical protein